MRVQAKAAMRKRARGVRAAMTATALAERSARIVERLLAVPCVAEARTIGAFWPIERQKEVDLRDAYARLTAAGKRLAFPRIEERDGPLAFAWVTDVRALEEGGHGFAEPPPDAPRADALDVVLVPALLVDPRGHRLGYGAGYYDRTLPGLRPPARAVAVAFSFQLALEVPALETDVAVDVVVTDDRTLDAAP